MSMNNHNPDFKNTILDALPPQLVSDYLADGLFLMQSFTKNELIHIEGDPCTQIEIILFGEIVIERIGISGDLMTLTYFHKGNVIGANLIFSSTDHYPMTITARKPTDVIVIQKDVLFELCNIYPSFLIEFIKIISDLSVLIGTKMKNRVSRTIRQSILTYLNKQYLLQETAAIRLTLSKKAMAEMFGVSRTSLSRELQKMKQEGLIDYDNKTIHILDINLIQK